MNQEKILIFSDLVTPHDFHITRQINVAFPTVFFDGISGDRREEQGRETGKGLEKSRQQGGQMIHTYQTTVLSNQKISLFIVEKRHQKDFFQGIQNALQENMAITGYDGTEGTLGLAPGSSGSSCEQESQG